MGLWILVLTTTITTTTIIIIIIIIIVSSSSSSSSSSSITIVGIKGPKMDIGSWTVSEDIKTFEDR